MDSPNFQNTRKVMGPDWLVKDEGESELVGFALDAVKDAFVERLRQGRLSHFPQQDPTGTPAADDALAAMGRDRLIVRGINEPSKTYAARLIPWLDVHATRGNPFTLLKELSDYCGPGPAFRTVDAKGNWFSRAADGTQSVLLSQANWDWSTLDLPKQWSRFWVILYPNGLWNPGVNWGDPTFIWGAPGLTWGTTATPEQVQSVRGIIRDWKPGGTTCINIIIAFDNTSFDPTHPVNGIGLPDGTWRRWGKPSSGGTVPSRLSTARYWQGT